jgi:hypothetical protein
VDPVAAAARVLWWVARRLLAGLAALVLAVVAGAVQAASAQAGEPSVAVSAARPAADPAEQQADPAERQTDPAEQWQGERRQGTHAATADADAERAVTTDIVYTGQPSGPEARVCLGRASDNDSTQPALPVGRRAPPRH